MPCDYSKYPKNWKTEIRPRILKRAKNRCEHCGVDNYAVCYYRDGVRYPDESEDYFEIQDLERTFANSMSYKKEMNKEYPELRHNVVVLTVAHLDHNIDNNSDENLKALCQKCHLGHDAKLHALNSAKTRDRKRGQKRLF